MTLLRGVLTKSMVGAAALVMLAGNLAYAQPAAPSAPGSVASSGGFGAVSGAAAAAFRVPSDVKLDRRWRDPKNNLTYSRYQQYVQPQNAAVDGAQLTVVKRGSTIVLVMGGYYPSLRVKNKVLVSGTEATAVAVADKKLLRNAAAADNGAKVKTRVRLWLNPSTGRLFQQVESGTMGQSFVHQVDAETGDIIDSWDATEHVDPGHGIGVKGDDKDLTGLTTFDSTADAWRLRTSDFRIQTHNANHTLNMTTPAVMGDPDNVWDTPSEIQPPGVDAQYYTAYTDNWYLERGFDLVDDCAQAAEEHGWADTNLHVVVHYANNYSNAFFDDTDGRFGYGDGDEVEFREFSAGQDVVSHEVTHRVTECRAPLVYRSWSGALNESISDIMATAIEWELDEQTPSSGCQLDTGQAICPDWWLGEDITLSGAFGLRNLADPGVTGDPSHWDERYCPGGQAWCGDNGGVHINSNISNHAFYLMVQGGINARCEDGNDPQPDCDVVVTPIAIDDAAAIMFAGWGLLPNPSPSNTAAFSNQFCNAHDATVAEAALLFPGSQVHADATDMAWSAVGRGSGDCPGPDETPPTASVSGVALASSGAVGTNGSIPLLVTWSASDAQSGIAQSQVQKSVTGVNNSWSTAAT